MTRVYNWSRKKVRDQFFKTESKTKTEILKTKTTALKTNTKIKKLVSSALEIETEVSRTTSLVVAHAHGQLRSPGQVVFSLLSLAWLGFNHTITIVVLATYQFDCR
jgi:hypothetical protein